MAYLHGNIELREILKMQVKFALGHTKSRNNGIQTSICPTYIAAKILGKKWTLDILRDLFEGFGNRHFTELKHALSGVSPKILSHRLKELQKFGLVERKVHSDTVPVGVSYHLTEKGWGLVPVLAGLESWEMKFFDACSNHQPVNLL